MTPDPLRQLVETWRQEADDMGPGNIQTYAGPRLRRCADDLERVLQAAGWRPIDTAPNDGTEVLTASLREEPK